MIYFLYGQYVTGVNTPATRAFVRRVVLSVAADDLSGGATAAVTLLNTPEVP